MRPSLLAKPVRRMECKPIGNSNGDKADRDRYNDLTWRDFLLFHCGGIVKLGLPLTLQSCECTAALASLRCCPSFRLAYPKSSSRPRAET